MIYITQLIYVIEGKENIFHQFEEVAIPLIAKYNGQLLLRVRPNDTTTIQASIESPYEIHLVSFASENDLNNFKQDEERQKFLHLKDASIQTVLMIKGEKI